MHFETVKGCYLSRVQPNFTTAPNQVIRLVSILVYGRTRCLRYVVHQCQYLKICLFFKAFYVEEYLLTAIYCSDQEKMQTNQWKTFYS